MRYLLLLVSVALTPSLGFAGDTPEKVTAQLQPLFRLPFRFLMAGEWEKVPQLSRLLIMRAAKTAVNLVSEQVPEGVAHHPFVGAKGSESSSVKTEIQIVLAYGSNTQFPALEQSEFGAVQNPVHFPTQGSDRVHLVALSRPPGEMSLNLVFNFNQAPQGMLSGADREGLEKLFFDSLFRNLFGEVALRVQNADRWIWAASDRDRDLIRLLGAEQSLKALAWLVDRQSPLASEAVVESFRETTALWRAAYLEQLETSVVPTEIVMHPDLRSPLIVKSTALLWQGSEAVREQLILRKAPSVYRWNSADLGQTFGKSVTFNVMSRATMREKFPELRAQLSDPSQVSYYQIEQTGRSQWVLHLVFVTDAFLTTADGQLRPDAYALWLRELAWVHSGLVPAFIRSDLASSNLAARTRLQHSLGDDHPINSPQVAADGHEGALYVLQALSKNGTLARSFDTRPGSADPKPLTSGALGWIQGMIYAEGVARDCVRDILSARFN